MKPATLTAKLKEWQGSRTAVEAARDLGISPRTYEGWRDGHRPRGLGLTALLGILGQTKPKTKPAPNGKGKNRNPPK